MKIDLSDSKLSDDSPVKSKFEFNGNFYRLSITRKKFEQLCDSQFRRCLIPIDNVLAQSKMQKDFVHEVLMVGGCSNIAKIRSLVQEYFFRISIKMTVDPCIAVAQGATVFGNLRDLPKAKISIKTKRHSRTASKLSGRK